MNLTTFDDEPFYDNSIWEWILLPIIISYTSLAYFVDLDKGQNIRFLAEITIFAITYSKNVSFRQIVHNKLILIWLVLILYHWINHGVQNVEHEYSYLAVLNSPFNCWFTMVWVAYLYQKDACKTLNYCVSGFLLFITLSAYVDIYGDVVNEHENRLSGAIHTTQLGQSAGLLVLLAVYTRFHNKVYYLQTIIIIIISAVIMLAAGSRNGMFSFFMGIISLQLAPLFGEKIELRNIFLTVFWGIIVFYLFDFFLYDTHAGERLLGTKEQAETFDEYETGTILDILGDRTWYYVVGWANFLQNPLIGIGFENFRHYNNTIWICHPEYMVHIAEGGLIAICLFFPFMFLLTKYTIRNYIQNRTEESFVLCLFVCVMLFACLSATIHKDIQYWPFIGICIANIIRNQEKQII